MSLGSYTITISKKMVVIVVAACLTVVAIAGMLTANAPVAYTAVGALAGWLGASKNGEEPAEPEEEAPSTPP